MYYWFGEEKNENYRNSHPFSSPGWIVFDGKSIYFVLEIIRLSLSVKMCHHEEQKNLWIHRYEAKFLPVKISDNVSDVVQFEVKHVKIHRSYMWKIKLMDMPLLVFLCNII